jgi:hypothetical protein
LEQAKSALNQLQQMVQTIHPAESSSSTPVPRKSPPKNMEPFLHTPTSSQQGEQSVETKPDYPNVKMAAQHREIERLVESRQRIHTIKDQIASLHQSMTTPESQSKSYEEKLNDSRNLRPRFQENDSQSEYSGFEDEELGNYIVQPRMKQSVGELISEKN